MVNKCTVGMGKKCESQKVDQFWELLQRDRFFLRALQSMWEEETHLYIRWRVIARAAFVTRTLSHRQLRGDLIMLYKILNN